MTAEYYRKWVNAHRCQSGDIDITDAVMERIVEKGCKAGLLKQTWERISLDLMQSRISMRMGVMVTGVFVGLVRMLMQFYAVLFT